MNSWVAPPSQEERGDAPGECAIASPDLGVPAEYHLYRCFDDVGALLYVGISFSAFYRLSQHRDSSTWFHLVASVSIERFPSRADVLLAETKAIQDEAPRFNIKKRARFDRMAIRAAEVVDVEEKALWRVVNVELIYTPTEVAEFLKCGPASVGAFIASGELRATMLPGRHPRFGDKPRIAGWDLIEFLQRRRKL